MKSSTAANAKKVTNNRTPNNKRSSKKISPTKRRTVKNGQQKPPPPSLPEGWPVTTSDPFLLAMNTTVANQKSRKPHENQPQQLEADGKIDEGRTGSCASSLRPKNEDESSNESVKLGLPPGTMLQKCTGEDIRLSKNSDTRPNFAIGRGRFLFVLPGMLSLRPSAPSPSVTAPLKDSNGNAEKDGTDEAVGRKTTIKDMVTNQANKRHDIIPKQEIKSMKQKTSSSDSTVEKNIPSHVPPPPPLPSSTLQTLGKVKNLKTSNPSLVIPLPNGQILTFKGKKIPCTSRFLVLTCRSSGKVQCRDVFQEIVAFGDVSLTPPSDIKATATEALPVLCLTDEQKTIPVSLNKIKNSHNNNNSAGNTAREDDEKQEDNNANTRVTFHHYGGSDRTVDGGRCLKLSKSSRRGGAGANAQKATDKKIEGKNRKELSSSPRKKRRLSTATKKEHCINEDDNDSSKDSDNDDDDNDDDCGTKRRKNDKSGDISEKNGNSDDPDRDEEEYISHARGELSTPLQTPRKRSARLSSSTKKVQYSFQSDNDSDDDNMLEEDSVSENSSKCKESESDGAMSRISEVHDSHTTSMTTTRTKNKPHPKQQSSGNVCANSTGKKIKSKKECLSSSVDLTNDDESSSKSNSTAINMKVDGEVKIIKANLNDGDDNCTIANTSRNRRKKCKIGDDYEKNETSYDIDEQGDTSDARGEKETPLQTPRKRSARLSSSTKKVQYSFQSDNDSEDGNVKEDSVSENSSICKESEKQHSDSGISEVHDSLTASTTKTKTKTTPHPKRQPSGNVCANSTGKKMKSKKDCLSSSVDLTNDDESFSKSNNSAKNVKISCDKVKTIKVNSNIVDAYGNSVNDDNDDDVIVIHETPKHTHKRPRGKLKSPGSAEYSYRRRRKSSAPSISPAIKLTPSKRRIADDLNTGFGDDEFQFLDK